MAGTGQDLSTRRAQGAKSSSAPTVWLVEDEAMVGRLMRKALESGGYLVRWFINGEEALEEALEADPADLLVTDISLPGLSGLEVAQRLVQNWPGLPVLVTSGYMHDAQSQGRSLPEDFEYLPKPFTPRILLDRLAKMRA